MGSSFSKRKTSKKLVEVNQALNSVSPSSKPVIDASTPSNSQQKVIPKPVDNSTNLNLSNNKPDVQHAKSTEINSKIVKDISNNHKPEVHHVNSTETNSKIVNNISSGTGIKIV